jgi:hypothetical protein
VFVAVTWCHGLSLSPDSAVYLSSAEHLLKGRGLTSYSGHTLVVFPPAFPALAAGIGWLLGTDVAAAARILNAVCLALAVASACVLLRRHVRWRPLQAAAAATLVAAAPLVDVASHAWSEPAFIAVSLMGVLALEDLLVRPTRPVSVAAVVALVSSAFLVRYAGLALVATVLGSLFVAGRARHRRARLASAAVTGAAMIAAPAAWIGRNLAVSGSAFGGREAPDVGMAEQLRRTGGEIARWIAPGYLPVGLRSAGIGIVAAVALAVVVRLFSNPARQGQPSLVPLLLFSISYLLVLEVSAAVTQVDPLGARLLSPLFVPALVVGFALLDRVRDARRPNRPVAGVLVLGVACWAALSIVAGGKRAHALAAGDGYTSAVWRDSALARRLRQSPSREALFSNRPDAVWATTRRDARCPPPQLGADLCQGSSGDSGDLRLLEAGGSRAEFAWFTLGATSAPPHRRGSIRFSLEARSADGALYELGPAAVVKVRSTARGPSREWRAGRRSTQTRQ